MVTSKFEYTGYSEKKLFELCTDKNIHSGFSNWYHWTAEVYSFGKYLREYGFYPLILPLHIYTDHGPGESFTGMIQANELNSSAYCQFYHSPINLEKFKLISSKPCYSMLSPFVYYRKKNKIEKLPEAKGTLAFPAHSTPNVDNLSNIEDYVIQLKNLPEEFQPVCACIYMRDVDKMQHRIFMKHNIPVYTVGHVSDYRFAKRFYDLLKNFKYSTSNIIGSYTYYSVEMGIPFFAYGEEAQYFNNTNPNIPKGEFKIEEYEVYNKIFKMFEGIQTEITEEQKQMVEMDLGIYSGISRFEMAKILYLSYLKQGNLFKDLIPVIKRYLRKPGWLIAQIKAEIFDF